MYKRTNNCGELRSSDLNSFVALNGWVNKVRLHGQVVFVDLRDRYGKTQIVFDADEYEGDFDKIKKISMEDVLSIKGMVRARVESAINPYLDTGQIEILVSKYLCLNEFDSQIYYIVSDNFVCELEQFN